jgi:acyl-CoA thioesterase-1
MRRILAFVVTAMLLAIPAKAETITLLALGDSLTAGYGLQPTEAFPVKLEAALKAKGHDVTVINASVSGDTASQGASRLDWALTDDVDAVLVELGANDALRGLAVDQAQAALDEILGKLATKKLPTLILGMKAPPNLGPDYGKAFDDMYPALAKKHGAMLYPFFLFKVAAVAELNQADGIHPNDKGVDVIVATLLPQAEALVAAVKNSR